MPNPKHGFQDFEREWADWAGDRECGTEARAIQVAHELGITGFNSQSDATAVNNRCKEQNEPEEEPEEEVVEEETSLGDSPFDLSDQELQDQGFSTEFIDQLRDIQSGAVNHAYDLELGVNNVGGQLAIDSLFNESRLLGQHIDAGSDAFRVLNDTYIRDVESKDDLAASNFGNLMNYKAQTDSERIRGAFGVEINKVIGAGNAEVAKIQGEYGVANTDLQGKYNFLGETTRANAARDVAQRNKEATLFGSILSGFW